MTFVSWIKTPSVRNTVFWIRRPVRNDKSRICETWPRGSRISLYLCRAQGSAILKMRRSRLLVERLQTSHSTVHQKTVVRAHCTSRQIYTAGYCRNIPDFLAISFKDIARIFRRILPGFNGNPCDVLAISSRISLQCTFMDIACPFLAPGPQGPLPHKMCTINWSIVEYSRLHLGGFIYVTDTIIFDSDQSV